MALRIRFPRFLSTSGFALPDNRQLLETAGLVTSAASGLTAKASGTQANGTQIGSAISEFSTVGTSGDSAVLPVGRAGETPPVWVYNSSGTPMTIYGGGATDTINGVTTGYSLAGGKLACFVCFKTVRGVASWAASVSA